MSLSIAQFIERLAESGLMSAAEVSTFQDSIPPEKRPKDVQQLAQVLVQRGKLTKYQAQAAYQGKTKGLAFGEYVVLDKLGEGGMGVVLKAQHRRMKRTVAIKILSASAMKQAGAIERFHREVEAAAKLSHPNIVTAFDASEHQGMHYLAMEYVEGRDLASIVKDRGPLGVREAVECVLQAARGLQYAHEQGIVHRDIKPGNLLLDKKGTVKILDMGLARIAGADAALGGSERLTASGQVMGTCDYMAPEQAFDSHNVDTRADIYALGCTLYRLVTGQPPYVRETLMQVLVAHREEPIPSVRAARPDVPAELDALFQKLLAKKPENRYQSMAEVAAELEAILGLSSGRPAAAATKAESSSAALSRSLAFLRENRPVGTLTKPLETTGAERTMPYMGRQDTGTNILGKVKRAAGAARRKPLVLLGIGGGLVLLLGIILVLTLRHGTLTVEINESLGKDVQVAVSQGGRKVQLVDRKSGWTLSLSPGKYGLAVQGGDDRFQLDSQSITVTRGGQMKVRVTLKPVVAPFDAREPRKYQDRCAKQLGVPVEMANSIGMKLVLIPPGEFEMGSPKELIEEGLKAGGDDQWYKDHLPGEGPQHRVRITKPFYLGTYLVMQGEYQRVMGVNPSEFSATGKEKDKVAGQDTKRFPVENVSWDEAVEFCRKLSEMPEEKAAGRVYRLPSEAQWEYACRAGGTGRYSFSSGRSGTPKEYEEHELSNYDWFGDNAGGMPHRVGLKRASGWGLYDMQGNVWEWCQDWYDRFYYANSPMDDPAGPLDGSNRVQRGGSWFTSAGRCRPAYRLIVEPGGRYYDLGFRVSLVLPGKPEASETQHPAPSREHPVPGTRQAGPPPAVAPFDTQQARKHQESWAGYLGVPVEMTNPVGMKLVLIPPGEFTMGEGGDAHKVTITKAFYLGKYELTQEEWEAVMGKAGNASEFKGPRNPVESVSWGDCQLFLEKLNEKLGDARGSYRLPTEAQWEYACRAGSTGEWCFGDSEFGLDDYGWYEKNSEKKTHPVGEKKPNAWGLFDMHGNVWEWCADWFREDYYKTSPQNDPPGPSTPFGSFRVRRGGSWFNDAGNCRSADRHNLSPGIRSHDLGFRVSLALADKPAASGTQYSAPTTERPAPATQQTGPPPAVAPFDDKKAKEHQTAWAKHLGVPVEITNSIGMKLVLIPPGEFMMGSPKELIEAELKRPDNDQWYKERLPGEGPQHRVRVTRLFYLGTCLVTQEEYQRVMGTNPSEFSATGKGKDKVAGQDTKPFPVENVSWDDAVEFCRKLSDLPEERSAGRTYRLPSEAQWEYACRAGNTGRYGLSLDGKAVPKEYDENGLSDYSWFYHNSDGRPHAVGGKRANAWGLYDMHGNVWEWCQDWYDKEYYANSPTDDPVGPSGGSGRVVRGGCWDYPPRRCRSAYRADDEPGRRYDLLGFRASLVLADKPGPSDTSASKDSP